ncbi:potassium transporter TrkH [Desulfovibrio sp. OttesenSCG-928-G11]|nr:potassium transporter TrkH [Desulfovibrio sp. OttesenSCG-928-G11]
MMQHYHKRHYVTPFVLPIMTFLLAILLGGTLLSLEAFSTKEPVSIVDAFFVATSAVCVTGLSPIDVFSDFTLAGQWVIIALMQLGCLGIITYTTLIFYIIGKNISLRDRLAVQQSIIYSNVFSLRKFIKRIVFFVFAFECIGFLFLLLLSPKDVTAFDALFLAVSAFCNAGFAPWPDSLMQLRHCWGFQIVIMSLIIVGGLGFFVINEIAEKIQHSCRRTDTHKLFPATGSKKLSLYSKVVITTTLGLLAFGTLFIFLFELGNTMWREASPGELLLTACFQTVTSRTAGFATADLATFTDITLLITIFLMFVGGSPSSAAGGIKTTTFRVLLANLVAQIRGRKQAVIQNRAINSRVLNNAMLLFYYAILTILLGTFLLAITENGLAHHGAARLPLFKLFFEVVSAFSTTGLSINITPLLTDWGKIILCGVMFIGKLGPVWLITTIQQFHTEIAYAYPEESIPIG